VDVLITITLEVVALPFRIRAGLEDGCGAIAWSLMSDAEPHESGLSGLDREILEFERAHWGQYQIRNLR